MSGGVNNVELCHMDQIAVIQVREQDKGSRSAITFTVITKRVRYVRSSPKYHSVSRTAR